jgi:hypothetical protein
MLTRYNRKTVTVITDEGRQWNVSPGVLSRVIPTEGIVTLTSVGRAKGMIEYVTSIMQLAERMSPAARY